MAAAAPHESSSAHDKTTSSSRTSLQHRALYPGCYPTAQAARSGRAIPRLWYTPRDVEPHGEGLPCCLRSQCGGIVPWPYASNSWFFTYPVLLCILLLCILGC